MNAIVGTRTTPSKPNVWRRLFDVIFSSLFLLAASPVFVLIAIAIYYEGGRPIFFSHYRLGRQGRPFRMYKFRKFHKECSANGLQLTRKGDARFTRVGEFLASYKLDELPQFWNVLVGDMSLIGPRPESLAYQDCFTKDFERVLHYKPGIFGPSQVQFRNESSLYPEGSDLNTYYEKVIFPAKARIDLDYYPNRTFAKDLGWLSKSILVTLNIYKEVPPGLDDGQSRLNAGGAGDASGLHRSIDRP